MTGLPTGTITFVFTDIEGSTQLWEKHPTTMPAALKQHDTILRQSIEKNGGYVFKTVGDAFCATFAHADKALHAALEIQHALQNATWQDTGPLRVRMALHTGTAEERDNDYFGPTVNRVARLLSTGYGSQILLSLATHELVSNKLPQNITLRDLGDHRLKDLVRSERIYQVEAPNLPTSFPALKSLNQFAHNLPIQPTRFIGREKELHRVVDHLQHERLITLIGPGGTGKTRLSLQVAAEVLENYSDGVWYIELSPLTDPTLVVSTIASVLGIQEQADRSPQEGLITFLQPKQLLLILDNCEHLVEACADLANILLRNCEHLQILATSREALHIGGESLWTVLPLQCPDPAESIDSLAQYEAVQLFIDRAKSVRSNFALTPENASSVAQLCTRLDGIPLALELAAVRIKMLSAEQICARLDDRFRLLTGGSRTSEQRQQTLAAAVDWSYALLGETEQNLFCDLSIFRGGWTLEAAERIAIREGTDLEDVLEGLTSLVDKSLVFVSDSEMRYDMQETLREYGRQKQEIPTEIERKYTNYYLETAQDLNHQLEGSDQSTTLHQMALELDNFRETQKIAQRQNNSTLLGALGAALASFYELKGLWAEGIECLTQAEAALAILPLSLECIKLQSGLGRLHWRQNTYDQALKWHTSALNQARDLNDQMAIAEVLINLGNLSYSQENTAQARQYFTESLQSFHALGDKIGIARTLHSLGVIALEQGDYTEAQNQLTEALKRFHKIENNLGIARVQHMLGVVAYDLEAYAEAQTQLTEALQRFRKLDNKLGIARSLRVLGQVIYDQKYDTEAQDQLTESLQLFRQLGDKVGIATTLHGLIDLAIDRKDYATAQDQLAESLQITHEFGTKQTIAYTLYRWARLVAAQASPKLQTFLLLIAIKHLDNTKSKEALRIKTDLDKIKETHNTAWIEAIQQKTQNVSLDEVVLQLLSNVANKQEKTT